MPKAKQQPDLLVLTAKAYAKSGGIYTDAVQRCYVAARRAGLSGREALLVGARALFAYNNGGLVR